MASRKPLIFLSLGFFLIFFGLDGAQQFLTSYFVTLGRSQDGYTTLLLIYVSFLVFSPLTASLIAKLSSKKSMGIAVWFYFLFILALAMQINFLIWLSAAALGAAATLLWTGQNTYLVQTTPKKQLGQAAGTFDAFRMLGSGLGVIVFGWMVSSLGYPITFRYFALLPLIALIPLLTLPQSKPATNSQQATHFWKLLFKISIFRVAISAFVLLFIQGLVVGYIPVALGKILEPKFVGLLTSWFFIIPVFFAFMSGWLSDRIGRGRMAIMAYLVLIIGLLMPYLDNNQVIPWVAAIIALAIGSAMMSPTLSSLVGDLSNSEQSTEDVAAVFWFMRIAGVVTAFLLAKEIKASLILPVAILLVFAALFISYAPLKQIGGKND